MNGRSSKRVRTLRRRLAPASAAVMRETTGTTSGQYFPGSLSDVWVFQGALAEAQIDHLAIGTPGMDTAVPSGD